MMTRVWDGLRENDCDEVLEKSTIMTVDEEVVGYNCQHSSDKSTTWSSDSPHSSPPINRLCSADPPQINLCGNLSKEDDLNFAASLDDYSDSETETETETDVDGRSPFQQYADLALAHYKEEKGYDYEYTGVGAVRPFRFPSGYLGTHLNFFARPRGSGSKVMVLFYAELNHRENKVYNCCILPEEHASEGYMMIHPQHVHCEECKAGGGFCVYGEDSDSESVHSLDSEDKPSHYL